MATFLSSISSGLRMQGVSRLPNSTLYVVEPGYLGLCLAPTIENKMDVFHSVCLYRYVGQPLLSLSFL